MQLEDSFAHSKKIAKGRSMSAAAVFSEDMKIRFIVLPLNLEHRPSLIFGLWMLTLFSIYR